MRAPVLLLALAALLAAASGTPAAPAEAPAPLRHLDVAELTAMQARLAALAQDVQRALATAPGGPAPAEAATPKSKLEYLHDSLMMSLDALHDLRDATQVGPSVQLRWRTLRRALWALLRRGALAAVDYVGALALFALFTGKLYAIQLAYDDTQRLVFGLLAAASTGVASLPWPWRALAAPPLLAGTAAPALLLFVVFTLQRVLVADRALLGFAALATAGHLAAGALQPWRALPPGLPAAGALFWAAARVAAAALAAGLALRLRSLAAIV